MKKTLLFCFLFITISSHATPRPDSSRDWFNLTGNAAQECGIELLIPKSYEGIQCTYDDGAAWVADAGFLALFEKRKLVIEELVNPKVEKWNDQHEANELHFLAQSYEKRLETSEDFIVDNNLIARRRSSAISPAARAL